MTFWKSLKPAVRPIAATHVELDAAKASVSITWSDGTKSIIPSRRLRQYCPCAGCVEEWSGRRTFSVDSIAEDMKVLEVQAVGNYALALTFADQHNTGIFEWSYLKKLGEGAPQGSRG